MTEPKKPVFLVNAYTDPVVVKITGKANYTNCNAFREFMEKMLNEGRGQFVLDFSDCLGMDSTFLGILAGTALELRRKAQPGELKLCRLSERNHELISNLGLQHLLSIDGDEGDGRRGVGEFSELDNQEITEAESVLRAHENLVAADEENAAKFQDVISFLRNQVEEESEE